MSDLERLPVGELKKRLKALGMCVSGTKAELIIRLSEVKSDAAPQPVVTEEKDEKKRTREDEDDPEPESKRVTRSKDPKPAKAVSAWASVESLRVLDPAGLAGNARIVSFDMDDTLIETKSGKVFAQGRSDWKWLFPSVPEVLKRLHADGVKLVIFTNQGGIDGKSGYDVTKERSICGKIEDIIAELGIPVQVFVATTEDKFRKPATEMWDLMISKFNGGVAPDLRQCTFVGDAAGRAANPAEGRAKKDFSCSDRKFAYNVGIAFKTPEEFFENKPAEPFEWDAVEVTKIPESGEICEGGIASLTSPKQELIILCGFPASGKSTFAKTYLIPKGYVHINRDTLKTPKKCLDATKAALGDGKSVVVDNTNPGTEARSPYIAAAAAGERKRGGRDIAQPHCESILTPTLTSRCSRPLLLDAG